MATRDFDKIPPEDPNASDIESEKDVFNDETFGVDINDLEGNEFDFSSTNAAGAAPNQLTYPNQNMATRHGGHMFNVGDEDEASGDSDDLNGQTSTQPQLSKPFSQRNEGNTNQDYYRGDENNAKGRHFEQPTQTRQPQYFRPEQTEKQQPQQQQQQQQQQPTAQNPFRLNFAALSLATHEQRQFYGGDEMQGSSRREYNQNQNPNQRDINQSQNQGPNVSFQPFSFTGNGYRRPQWDDEADSAANQQRNFQQNRGPYQQHNNGSQPQYFRNRQQQQQNWQQRDHYGGGYQQRHGGYQQRHGGYQQRYDNNDYEDRGRWQHRDREYRHFERRGPHDQYAGLMTWREKLTVLRIQLLQIISDRGPNFDDYYAKMLAEKRKEQSLRAAAAPASVAATVHVSPPKNMSLSGNESSDNEESRLNEHHRRRLGVDNQRRRTVSASTDNNNNQNTNTRNRIPIPRLSVVDVQPYKPLEFQGTLGKWTTTTVTRPRQIIDCSAMQNLEDLQETGGRKGESTAKLLRQALGSVERLYDFVLIAEDLERQIKLSSDAQHMPVPPPDVIPEGNVEGALRVGSFQSTNMPKPVDPIELETHLVITRHNIGFTLCAPTRLALILAIKKGRKILPRALKTLDRGHLYADSFELALQLASVLCEHLPLLIRRETNAAALVAVVTPLCSFVKSVILTRSVMPSPVNNDDFLFTVRAILADKALSTRSPELVTLLASLISVRK